MMGYKEAQGWHLAICGPSLAYKRRWDSPDHVVVVTRDAPLGYPKGGPIKGRKPAEVASQEAYEEAGLIGQVVGKRPLGNYHYEKRLAKRAIICEVRVR